MNAHTSRPVALVTGASRRRGIATAIALGTRPLPLSQLNNYGTIVADLARAVLILLLLTVRARTAEVLIEEAILKCPLRR